MSGACRFPVENIECAAKLFVEVTKRLKDEGFINENKIERFDFCGGNLGGGVDGLCESKRHTKQHGDRRFDWRRAGRDYGRGHRRLATPGRGSVDRGGGGD